MMPLSDLVLRTNTRIQVTLAVILVLGAVFFKTRRRKGEKVSLAHIPGPKAPSYVLGNLVELFNLETGVVDWKWTKGYGGCVRIKGMFGSDRLFISDPKALQHICANAATDYIKPLIRREAGRMFLGTGIAWAQGADHKRHRKILTPAFGVVEMRALQPAFREVVQRMATLWKDKIESTGKKKTTTDVSVWLSKATLDIIGEVAFDYRFDMLRGSNNKLAKVYNSFLVHTFSAPSPTRILVQQLIAYLPESFYRVLEHLPSHSLKPLRDVKTEGGEVGKELIKRGVVAEKGKRNVLELLLRANETESPGSRLSDEELISQIRTILAAGHETTNNTIAFALYELASHPTLQERLRTEIQVTLREARLEGHDELSMSDLERMDLCVAFMKEVLRLHPAVYQTWLQCAKAVDTIPLSKPIRTVYGKMINEVTVGKGTSVHLSIAAYNRLEEIFGPNPDELRPERWMDPEKPISSPFGVYSNLGNFISGSQACLGWRFATIEIQTFFTTLLLHFRFSFPPSVNIPGRRIIRAAAGVMAPVVEGELGKGKQLPLAVEALEDGRGRDE